MATFDLGSIFRNAFGYDAPEPDAELMQALEKATTSDIGQPYYLNDLAGLQHFLPVTLNGYVVPFAVLNVAQKNIIVSTPMPDRNGCVKEMITTDDVVFNIKGICITNDSTFPEDSINDIQNLFLLNESVEMRSVVSDIVLDGRFNHAVTITDIHWHHSPGSPGAKAFELTCESDSLFDLETE